MKQQAILDNKLIENALNLTGKTMEDMKELIDLGNNDAGYCFSIEKFYAFLLSPEFIEKYIEVDKFNLFSNKQIIASNIGIAIYEYQLNNQEPLQELLSKIGKQ